MLNLILAFNFKTEERLVNLLSKQSDGERSIINESITQSEVDRELFKEGK